MLGEVCIAQSSNYQKEEQDNLENSELVNVFLDIHGSLFEYVRKELNFVNYVRDPRQADVHIMLSTEATGSGGSNNELTFLGRKRFSGVNDTLIHTFQKNDTRETQQAGLAKIIKIGLFSYITRLPMSETISSAYFKDRNINDGNTIERIEDQWNNWVFNISVDGEIDGEETQNKYKFDSDFSGNRVTEDMKFNLNISLENEVENYEIDGEDFESSTSAQSIWGQYVHSISDHYSAGIFGNVSSRTYNNIQLKVNAGPAIEYNLFPYSESIRKQFTFLYKIGYTNVDYKEETIYGKMKETLYDQSLEITYRTQETWGSLAFSLQGGHYFHDFSKRRLSVRGESSLRISEGFSLRFNGRIGLINDQLSLPAEGATEEEILLNQKELASQYDIRVWWGINYTFGSIYNNVVNTRFESGRRRR